MRAENLPIQNFASAVISAGYRDYEIEVSGFRIIRMQRIFISGIGVVSCLGNNRQTFWKNLKTSQCGIDRMTEHDIRDMEVVIGC